MVNEGQWPKADGDYLFGSEANRLASAGRYITVGSSQKTAATSGGPGYTDIGSFTIGAGSLTNPCQMMIDTVASGAHFGGQIEISGTSNNVTLSWGQNDTTQSQSLSATGILGSYTGGFLGILNAIEHGTNAPTNLKSAAATVSNLDTSSGLWVKLRAKTSDNNAKWFYYGIQAFRGTISGT